MNTEAAREQHNCLSQFARSLAIGARRVIAGQTRGPEVIKESEASVVQATSHQTTPAAIQPRVGASDSGDETTENVGDNCEQTTHPNDGDDSLQIPKQQPFSGNDELQGRLDL